MNWLEKTWSRLFEESYENKEREEKMKSEEWLDKIYPKCTMIYKKRYADVGFKTLLPMNVCDFLKPMETLKDNSSIRNIWNEQIVYVSDNFAVNGVLDYSQLPVETKVIKKGDCEDSSYYRVSKAKSNGCGSNLFVAFGFYKNQGHAFPIIVDYKNEKIFILEATSNSYNTILYKENCDYKINYIFNDRFSWVVDNSVVFGKKVLDEFEVNIYGIKKRKISKVFEPLPKKVRNLGGKNRSDKLYKTTGQDRKFGNKEKK